MFGPARYLGSGAKLVYLLGRVIIGHKATRIQNVHYLISNAQALEMLT